MNTSVSSRVKTFRPAHDNTRRWRIETPTGFDFTAPGVVRRSRRRRNGIELDWVANPVSVTRS